MCRTLVPALILAGALGACASPSGPPADRIVYRVDDAPAPRIDDSTTPGQPMTRTLPQVDKMTEAERMAWFRSQGLYPYPWYPSPEGQSLGYVHTPTDWGWVAPTVLTAGALYGIYALHRHYDWW